MSFQDSPADSGARGSLGTTGTDSRARLPDSESPISQQMWFCTLLELSCLGFHNCTEVIKINGHGRHNMYNRKHRVICCY